VARKTVPPPVKQVYKPKQREEMQKKEVDPERTTGQDIIQIGSMDVLIREDGKRPIVSNIKVVTSTPGVLLMTMRTVEVVPTPNTSCPGGVLPD
jgi:hypothetical protein